MRIAGLQKNSFVDYPGKIAAVIFILGCNMNCYYCHNRTLIQGEQVKTLYPLDFVLDFLERRKNFLEGVVITGGEPTLHHDLGELILKIRELGYAVKLDTNGTRPEVLEAFIGRNLVDYIAMDIKAPPHRYEEICGVPIKWESIKESIDLLLKGSLDYEFRTTIAPCLGRDDILAIGDIIKDARLYVLQQYRQPDTYLGYSDSRLQKTAHPGEKIRQWARDVSSSVDKCITRGV